MISDRSRIREDQRLGGREQAQDIREQFGRLFDQHFGLNGDHLGAACGQLPLPQQRVIKHLTDDAEVDPSDREHGRRRLLHQPNRV